MIHILKPSRRFNIYTHKGILVQLIQNRCNVKLRTRIANRFFQCHVHTLLFDFIVLFRILRSRPKHDGPQRQHFIIRTPTFPLLFQGRNVCKVEFRRLTTKFYPTRKESVIRIFQRPSNPLPLHVIIVVRCRQTHRILVRLLYHVLGDVERGKQSVQLFVEGKWCCKFTRWCIIHDAKTFSLLTLFILCFEFFFEGWRFMLRVTNRQLVKLRLNRKHIIVLVYLIIFPVMLATVDVCQLISIMSGFSGPVQLPRR